MARYSRFAAGAFSFAAVLALASTGSAQVTPKLTVPALNVCAQPRPEMCTDLYQPVCGVTKDGVSKTYGNACSACTHADVVRYTPGECKKP